MAYIRCVYGEGGSSSAVEVVSGTMTGASGSTSAGQITISSQEGKTPKSVQMWNTSNLSTYMGTIIWNSDYPATSIVRYGSNAVQARAVGAAANANLCTIMSVGANSITIQLPTGSTYYTGTWKYYAEFE